MYVQLTIMKYDANELWSFKKTRETLQTMIPRAVFKMHAQFLYVI